MTAQWVALVEVLLPLELCLVAGQAYRTWHFDGMVDSQMGEHRKVGETSCDLGLGQRDREG
jgi:hypothetical protein